MGQAYHRCIIDSTSQCSDSAILHLNGGVCTFSSLTKKQVSFRPRIQPLGSIQARMSSAGQDVRTTSQIEDKRTSRNEHLMCPKQLWMVSIVARMLQQNYSRTIPKSIVQTLRACILLLCSGQGGQGSIPLELWLPRETVCTVHLADGDARAKPLPNATRISEYALAIGGLISTKR